MQKPNHKDRIYGFSLLEVLVVSGVLAVIAAIMGSSLIALGRRNAMLSDQLASTDLARSISEVLKSPRCSLMLGGSNVLTGSSLTFDPALVSVTSPHPVALKAIPLGGSQDLISLSQPNASSLSPRLKLGSNGIVLEVTGVDSGALVLKWDPTGLAKPVADLRFPLTLETTVSGPTRTVVKCGGAGALLPVGTAISCSQVYISDQSPVPNPPCVTVDPITKETEVCTSGWVVQNCYGNVNDDCCVKVEANAFP